LRRKVFILYLELNFFSCFPIFFTVHFLGKVPEFINARGIFMALIVLPALFARVSRIAVVMLLLLTGLSPSAVIALPKNSEISRIMNERRAIEQNLANLKLQLHEYQSKLNSTARKESRSFKALENIRTQILVLEKMIGENQNYLKKLDGDIDRLHNELQGNRQIYGRVSDDFRRTAVSAYKYGGDREIEHFFSAGSVSNALGRAQYMGFFSRAVRRNVDELQHVAVKLENSRVALEQSYQQKAEMVREQEQQLKSWSATKKEKEVVLDGLKKNKQEYLVQLTSVQKKRRQLQSRIESLILAEQRAIEAENERQRKILEARRLEARRREAQRLEFQRIEAGRQEARRLSEERLESQRLERDRIAAQKENAVAPESAPERLKRSKVLVKRAISKPEAPLQRSSEKQDAVALPEAGSVDLERVSADFDRSLRSLPWPVRNGVVAQKFGSVEDKDLKIVTTNNGIDISVPASTQVRAVSGGKVVQIAFLPTFGNIVIIRHPKSYLTVYANLGQLNVVKDDLIKSQQLLGIAGRQPDGNSVVHFEIWKGRVKQNPAKWLR
jgi:septal ring factor EnvC (AmiA/AmiB activator)